VKVAKADVVVIATGSKPKLFSLEAEVHSAADVLLGKCSVGRNVVMIGGGLVGCETALYLRKKGSNVTIVEALDKILEVNGPLCHANKEMLTALILYKGVRTLTGSKATAYDGQTLTVYKTKDGKEEFPADTVVLAVGYTSINALYDTLKNEIPDIHLIGDARKVSNIMYAIWDAYELASHID
jgi:2-enoate reductase